MRIALTAFGLDLFTLEVTTDDSADGPGDSTCETQTTGFCLPEREGGAPELVD